MTLALEIYRRIMHVAHRLAPSLLQRRVLRGKEDPERFSERLGRSPLSKPNGALVWFHGVSVGESLSALPVIEELHRRRPDLIVLMTTATTTSAEILARRLPHDVIHQFAPIDTPQAVTAFLDHWRPELAIFIESDIWPILLDDLSKRKIPHVLLSARITERTYRGWQNFRTTVRSLLSGYHSILAQDKASEDRLRAMGSEIPLGPIANLKTLGSALPVDAKALQDLRQDLGKPFVYLAASTHAGEEALIAKAVEPALWGGDLLIVVPRHPSRADEIRLDLEAMGYHVAQRSRAEPVGEKIQIYLADTLGELGMFFTVADVTIMGGSFLDGIGGHNPLEPARLSRCVITGPDISNWQAIYDDLFAEAAAFKVNGKSELAFLVSQLRQHPELLDTANQKALALSQRQAGTLENVMESLTPLLPAC